MNTWLTPPIAVVLMSIGIFPSLVVVHTLAGQWRKPGVLWFIVSMLTGGLWALIFTLMTLIRSPEITLLLGNFFWSVVTTAAVSLFFLAYEFVFKETVSRRAVVVLFTPVLLLFVLSWLNPMNLVFGADYYVDAEGFLRFSPFGDPLRLLVVQLYGYLLVFFAAGLFVGGFMRTEGLQRRQTGYLLIVFSALVGSSIIKVAELVPIYYDPTSTVYAFSGLLFAYSIDRHGLLQHSPVARESTFEEIQDILLVVDASGDVIDTNRAGRQLFDTPQWNCSITDLLDSYPDIRGGDDTSPIQLASDESQRFFSIHSSPIDYGRGGEGTILVLRDVTDLTERERELNLLKEIFSRVFRHNIRNDLTVIDGYAHLLTEAAPDSQRVAKLSRGIRGKSRHLLGQSRKAQQISRVISDDRRVAGSLRTAVQDALTALESDRPTAEYEIRCSVADTVVEYHPEFHLAVVELIENAVEHHSGSGPPAVSIETETTDSGVRLTVADNGGGIPQSEIDVLEAQTETELEHSSGIGLWLTQYIVRRSNGTLAATTTDEGTQIRIELPQRREAETNGEPTDD